jgi:hypothetical protein
MRHAERCHMHIIEDVADACWALIGVVKCALLAVARGAHCDDRMHSCLIELCKAMLPVHA